MKGQIPHFMEYLNGPTPRLEKPQNHFEGASVSGRAYGTHWTAHGDNRVEIAPIGKRLLLVQLHAMDIHMALAKNILVGGWRLATDVLKYQKAHRHSPEKLDEGPGRKRSLFSLCLYSAVLRDFERQVEQCFVAALPSDE
jgi:hypothetical protein